MCGGPPAVNRPVLITFKVDAKRLYDANLDPETISQTDLDTYCYLTDDNTPPGSIPSGGNLNDFTSKVYDGNTVTWKGDNTANDGYRVVLDSITNNATFFSAEPHGNSGRITATINTGVTIGVEDTYTIGFHIDPPGNLPETLVFGLDPKLRASND